MGIFSPTKKVITAKQDYTIDEVFNTLKLQAGLPFEPYIKNFLGMKAIYIPSTRTDDVLITVKKNQITVTHKDKPSMGGAIGGAIGGALSAVKDAKKAPIDWSGVVGKPDYKIDDVVLAVADRVQRLLGV